MSGNVEILAFFAHSLVVDFGDDEFFFRGERFDDPFAVGRGEARSAV